MDFKKISELRDGESFTGYYILKEIYLKSASSNPDKKFIDLLLKDTTGEIRGKIWNAGADFIDFFTPGNNVKVSGTPNVYQNILGVVVTNMRNVTNEDFQHFDFNSLVESAPISAGDMAGEIWTGYISNIQNQDIRKITESFYRKYWEKLMYYPAAKSNHHAIKGGLLYHILTMLKTGKAIADIHPEINRDLLYAGILLHDIAKIAEMNSDHNGVVGDYTKEGHLIGHINMGVAELKSMGEKEGISDEVIMLLSHMVLSHHYEPEWGSPKKPMFLEAEILHYIDVMDSRIYSFIKAEKNLQKGTFSDRIPSLGGRNLYKPDL